MKPLSGKFLYINLGFAIVWDSLGFLLFFLGLTPLVVFTVVLSVVVDILAFLTDFTFCILYQGYVKIYNVNFRLYQIKRIKEMIQLSKISGVSKNPIANSLSRQTQKLNQYVTSKFSNYVWEFAVKKIQYSIITSVVELIPWLGDFSPSWTIKANLHLREHRKIARELKIRNVEFEQSLAKWRGALRIGGIRRVNTQSNNINSKSVRETAANNIRPFRKKLPSEAGQSLQGQKNINLDVREYAANNIVPFRRKVVGEGSQPRSGQNNNKLANVKSAAGNIASVGRQLVGSIPQSLEYEDDNLRDPKLPNNKTSPNDKKLINSGGRYMQSQNNSIEKPKGERLAGERAQAVIYPQDINPTIRETAANNIRPFNRKKTAGSGGQSTPRQKDINLDWKKSAAGNIASVGRQLAGSIPQSREYEDEELQYRKSSANKNKPSKTQVFSDISKPVQAQNNNQDNNNISVANNIKKFNRAQQDQANSEQILENLIKK